MTISIRQSIGLALLAVAVGVPFSSQVNAEAAQASANTVTKTVAKTSTTSVTAASKAVQKATSVVKTAAPVAPAAGPAEGTVPAPSVSVASAKAAELSVAVKQYKSRPDTTSWDAVWRVVREILSQPGTVKAPAASVSGAYPGLSELGVAVINGEGARIWAFPKIPEAQQIVVQWSAVVSTTVQRPVGRRHKMVSQVSITTTPHVQVMQLPAGVVLYDAHLTTGGHLLLLSGNTKATGAVWLQAYKAYENQWVETADAFASVPPFLIQNLVGKASFYNNDLILTVGGGKSASGKAQPQSSGYKIVLHFVDGHYALDSRGSEEGPALIALQFVQAVQQGHLDLAKGWLADPRLLSIPKYIGLTRNAGQPFKLIAMANPPGAYRYRLMTFEKDDLIMDIGKVKNQWAIKAIFIAPPDPLAQKLVGSLPTSEKAIESKAAEESNK